MEEPSSSVVREFYDCLVERQVEVGINERHQAIQRWLIEAGLRPDHRVLEVGCGVGTQTELVARFLRGGRITSIDMSPRSIERARERLAAYENVELIAGDYLELAIEGQYDVVLLPDVLEHILQVKHAELFRRVSRNLEKNGFVLIHMPDPSYQEYLQRQCAERLQPIDLPVPTDLLCASAYPSGFYIHFLSTYPIWLSEGEYQVVVLRKREARVNFTSRPEGKSLRGAARGLLARIRIRWRS